MNKFKLAMGAQETKNKKKIIKALEQNLVKQVQQAVGLNERATFLLYSKFVYLYTQKYAKEDREQVED